MNINRKDHKKLIRDNFQQFLSKDIGRIMPPNDKGIDGCEGL